MDRDRVVDGRRHAASGQVRAQRLAVVRADDEQVVDVVTAGHGLGAQLDGAVREALAQHRPELATAVVGRFEPRELRAQDRRLQGIEPRRGPDHAMVVAGLLTVRAQQAHPLGDLGVGRRHRAAVAPRPEVLGRVEREAPGVAQRADAAAVIARAVGLRGVLDHEQAGLARQREDRVHVDRLAIEVDRDDGARARAETAGHAVCREQLGTGVDVHGTGRCAGQRHALRRRDEGVGGDDDLVTGSDAQRLERERDRLRSRGDAERVRGLAPRRVVALEHVELLAEREGAGRGDAVDDVHQLAEQLGVGVVEPEQGHLAAALQHAQAAVACRLHRAPPG
jgi:hypothetical protein